MALFNDDGDWVFSRSLGGRTTIGVGFKNVENEIK